MNLFLISMLLILIISFLYKIKKRRDIGNKIHGPKSFPLLGHLQFYNMSLEDLLPALIKLQASFKNYYKLWLANELWIVIYEPKLAQKILTNINLIKSNDYKFLRPWLGNGLLTNDGKNWLAKRKAITPAFYFNILEDFIEIFEKHAEILLKKFENNESSIEVTSNMLLCSFDIICETAMGIKMNAQENSESDYVKAVHNISRIVYQRMFNPILQIDFIFNFLQDSKILKESLRITEITTQEVINKRRKYLEQDDNINEKISLDEMLILGKKKKLALLDILLHTKVNDVPLTDQEIQEEVNTFLFAGHDTTGSALSFLLYNIAKYPDIQEKICNEIFNVFTNDPQSTTITTTRLNELKYLDLVIKESMRIHTTVPFLGRQIIKETVIDDIVLPENTNASLFIYGMCHNEDIFKDCEKFIPERFDISNTANEFHPFSYIPFSAGHRNCIGQKFALLEMKTIVKKILEKYEIILSNPNEELTLIAGMVLKSKNGINLKFKKK